MVKRENLDLNIESSESIKLMKMSKGYNWEIKLFIDEVPALGIPNKIIHEDDQTMKRLEDIDNKLKEKFGEKKEEANKK